MNSVTGRDFLKLEPTFTLRQVAGHFNVTEQTVRRWVKRGIIVAHRAGLRKLVFTRKDIDAAAPRAR